MKKLSGMILVLALIMAIMIPAGVASADSSLDVSGEYVITVVDAECINYGSSCVLMVCLSYTSDYEGDIVGTAQECLYYGFSVNSDNSNRVGIQTFSGTVLGKERTYTACVRHRSLGDGDIKVEQTIISGTGELADIQGNLVFEVNETDPGVWEGTYSGSITFAP